MWCPITNAQTWELDDISIAESFNEIEPLFEIPSEDDGSITLINFWATWCGPCVKELPYIESLHQSFEKGKIDITLVSLDFKRDLKKKLLPFLNKQSIQSKVILLTDPKEHEWIDKVDPSWSGAIPITVIIKGGKKYFIEKVFHSDKELLNYIQSLP